MSAMSSWSQSLVVHMWHWRSINFLFCCANANKRVVGKCDFSCVCDQLYAGVDFQFAVGRSMWSTHSISHSSAALASVWLCVLTTATLMNYASHPPPPLSWIIRCVRCVHSIRPNRTEHTSCSAYFMRHIDCATGGVVGIGGGCRGVVLSVHSFRWACATLFRLLFTNSGGLASWLVAVWLGRNPWNMINRCSLAPPFGSNDY